MTTDTLLSLLDTSALRTVAVGAAGLGLVAGSVGAFAVLRRQSLQGDMVSHAALPGVAVAFLLGGDSPAVLILGGAAAGWVAMLLVGVVTRRSRVPFDAALGGALAVFFGLGLVLMTYIQKHPADFANASRSPLERYLFGQAALIRENDVRLVGGIGAAALLLLAAFWKELKLLSFDPDYAASLGLPVRRLDLLLTTLTVVAVVIGLKAVGVVLMTALLIAPAAAARQWTDRLGRMVLLSAAFGALAGLAGTVLSHVLSDLPGRRATVPTGPAIVLCATAIVLVSLLLGTSRGVLWKLARSASRRGYAAPGDDVVR